MLLKLGDDLMIKYINYLENIETENIQVLFVD